MHRAHRTPIAAAAAAVLASAAALLAAPAPGSAGPDALAIPGVGSVAPAFGLYPFQMEAVKGDSDRTAVELDRFCGIRAGTTRGVLLAFVDSSGLADLQAAAGWWRKWHKDGIEILGISLESNPAPFAQAIEKAGIKFPVLDDRLRIVAKRYGVAGSRMSFLLGRDCRVLGFSDRPLKQDEAALADALRALAEGELGAFSENPE